jgi:PHD/YefM family antitoxin component YafN of YafNO toxin-antitoxin module
MRQIAINLNDSKLATLIVELLGEPIRIDVNGKTFAMLISSEKFYELLEAEEEIEDLREYDESIRDASPNISWDEVKRDLGLS